MGPMPETGEEMAESALVGFSTSVVVTGLWDFFGDYSSTQKAALSPKDQRQIIKTVAEALIDKKSYDDTNLALCVLAPCLMILVGLILVRHILTVTEKSRLIPLKKL